MAKNERIIDVTFGDYLKNKDKDYENKVFDVHELVWSLRSFGVAVVTEVGDQRLNFEEGHLANLVTKIDRGPVRLVSPSDRQQIYEIVGNVEELLDGDGSYKRKEYTIELSDLKRVTVTTRIMGVHGDSELQEFARVVYSDVTKMSVKDGSIQFESASVKLD